METEKQPGLLMKYFVLKPAGTNQYSVASRKAMLTYADIIMSENPLLAKDLIEWVEKEREKANIH